MVTLFLIPKTVHATQTVDYTEYKVGDEITVWLDSAKTKSAKFRIIKNSAAGRDTRQPDGKITPNEKAAYQWVTAIYEGTVGESIYGVASDTDLSYEHSILRANVVKTTKSWETPKDIRLLTLSDLHSLVGSTDESTVTSALKETYPWILLDKIYWLGDDAFRDRIYKIDGTSKEANVAQAMTQTGIIFRFEESDSRYIRPVITIHKGFVEGGMICTCEDCEEPKTCPNKPEISIQACLDSGKSESVCIEELCKEKPAPKTCPNKPEISIQACLDSGKSESVCIEELCKEKPAPKTCPNKPEISIQACLDSGKSESVCIEELCKEKPAPKTCPDKPEISIQACLDSGKSELVCIKELCTDQPTKKVCPNDPTINIQPCIDSGKSEETCIKEKCTVPEKPDNPKTGTYISIGVLFCGIMAGVTYFIINRKKYFTKI